jgi:hypothetical protein
VNPELKSKLILATVCLGLGAIAGYELVPTRVEYKEKVVEKIVTQTETKKDRDLVRVKETRPDGTTITRTEIKDRTETNSSSATTKVAETSKTTERRTPVNLSLLAGKPLGNIVNAEYTFGLHASKQLLGPLSLGVWGTTDKTIGLSLGVSL